MHSKAVVPPSCSSFLGSLRRLSEESEHHNGSEHGSERVRETNNAPEEKMVASKQFVKNEHCQAVLRLSSFLESGELGRAGLSLAD